MGGDCRMSREEELDPDRAGAHLSLRSSHRWLKMRKNRVIHMILEHWKMVWQEVQKRCKSSQCGQYWEVQYRHSMHLYGVMWKYKQIICWAVCKKTCLKRWTFRKRQFSLIYQIQVKLFIEDRAHFWMYLQGFDWMEKGGRGFFPTLKNIRNSQNEMKNKEWDSLKM